MGTQEDPHQAGYFHMSSDISSMFSIREKIQQLVELSIQIVIENDATPEIENEFEPVLRAIEKTYPPFHKQGLHYFSTLCSMQETAKTNQLLSSAGVKLPLQNFTNDWKRLCAVIDHFTNINPPPHAKEISSKFKAVRSSLDTIKKTNERRKQPTPGITNCITNILALGKSVSKNIDDLFAHNYTDFGSNLYESLRHDVKSFLTVINEAFSNEFVQSGVMLCDLYRIRSNIFTDCNEIVESLKSAFVFPKEMREIKELKDTTEIELKQIFDKLSVQFVVIKPNQTDALSEISPNENKNNLLLTEENNHNSDNDNNIQNFLERDEIIPQTLPKQDYLSAINKIDEFIEKFYEIFDKKVDYTKDTWDNLDEIRKFTKNYKNLFEEIQKKEEILKNKINSLIEKNKDNEILFDKKNEALIKANEINKTKLQKIDNQNQDLIQKCADLQKENDKLRLKYSNLKAKGDALIFRKVLIEIGKSIDSKSKIDFLNQDELIVMVKNMVKSQLEKPCARCILLEDQLTKVKNNLINLIEKVKTQKNDLPEKVLVKENDMKKKSTENLPKKSKKNEVIRSTSQILKVNDDLSNSFIFTTQPEPQNEEKKSKSCNKLTKCVHKTASVVIKVNSNKNFLSKSSNTDSSDYSVNPLDILRNNYESSDATSEMNDEVALETIKETKNRNELNCIIEENSDYKDKKELKTINEEILHTNINETNIIEENCDQLHSNENEMEIKFSENDEETNNANDTKDNCTNNTNDTKTIINNKKETNDKKMTDKTHISDDTTNHNESLQMHHTLTNTSEFSSSDIDSLIATIDTMFSIEHSEIADLILECNVTKTPVIEAILMLDKTRNTSELHSFLPSRLKAILHDLVSEILSKTDQAKQTFKKREKQYVKTLFQISEKLSKMANEPTTPEFDENEETSKERDRIIDQISSQLKTTRQNMSNLENDLFSQKKSNNELRKQRDSIRLSFCSLFNFLPESDDRNNVEKCRQILQKEKNGYGEKIDLLTKKIEKLESDAVAVEELVNGVSHEKDGTLYEKLEKIHDKSDKMIQKLNEMNAEILKWKDAVTSVVSILENSNDLDDQNSLSYLVEFCKIHSGGIRIIDNSKLDLLLAKFEYNKNDTLYDILDNFIIQNNHR